MRVLIEFEKKPLAFDHPSALVTCFESSRIPDAFRRLHEALAEGFYVAGFLSYEAGYAFESKFGGKNVSKFPLLCFGIYDRPSALPLPGTRTIGRLSDFRLNVSKDRYVEDISSIRAAIERGDLYQVTYCIKVLFDYEGDAYSLYRYLKKCQPVPYPAYVETERFKILSLSPELFLKKNGNFLLTKPMKGTWPRGSNVFSDLWARRQFQYDEKNRAENVMIADLLRNDFGKIGSRIRARRLFEVDGYRTLFQMTSTVTATVDPRLSLEKAFQAVFPSGSVTGAPKIRAMEMLRDLEGEDRNIYTGAIGYATPTGEWFFNIPIRTLLLEGRRGEMGVGGGIVWDSTPEGEWQEGLLKASFLTNLSN